MEEKFNIRFKKGKRSTGLQRIGEGTPSTKIIVNNIYIGNIEFNDSWAATRYNTQYANKIKINFMKKAEPTPEEPNKKFAWVRYKAEFKNEEEAREFAKTEMIKLKDKIYFDESNKA